MDQAAADWWFSLRNPPCVCSAPLDVVGLVFFLQSAAFVTGWRCRRAPALAAAGKSCGGKGEKEKSAGRGGPDCWQMGCWDLELGCLESRCPRGAAGPSPSRGLYQSIPSAGCLHWQSLQQRFNPALLLCRGDMWDKVLGEGPGQHLPASCSEGQGAAVPWSGSRRLEAKL